MSISKIFIALIALASTISFAQSTLDDVIPIRGLCIAAPESGHLDRFIKFIDEELAPRQVNTLILRVDYNFQYKSHPELRDSMALANDDVKKLVDICKKHRINLVPQINLLGHQSWHSNLGNLLKVFPEFDETPHIELPEEYKWPNEDGLYCKSYCPLHPDVHDIVFDLIDEIMEVFNASAFHAGMDEVFYIGNEKCPRCSGLDKAELFAGEVTKIRNHLAQNDQELWIWGDRLIDGKTTGIGMWEASMNNTHRAIDMIPKDVLICDWHYERPDPTAVLFAIKGLRVATCPWRNGDIALEQLDLIVNLRRNATLAIRENYQGIIQTVWTSAENFMDYYYGIKEQPNISRGDQAGCFKVLFDAIIDLEK